MHEENHHNDSLERLFRKKAGEFDIPFREEDWVKLEKQLDIADLRRSYRRKVRLITAAAILLVSLLGYFTIENHNRLNQIAEQMESVIVPEPENIQPGEQLIPERETGNEFVVDTNNTANENEPAEPVTPPDDLVTLPAETEVQDEWLPETAHFTRKPISAEQFFTDYHRTNLEFIKDVLQDRIYYKTTNLHTDFLTYEDSHSSRFSPGSTGTESTESTEYTSSRFGISAAVSPDVSSAGSAPGFYNPGYKFGISGEYRLSSNLFLTGGLMASNVRYSAAGSRYNPPDYWNTGVVPDELKAVCLILDIPIGLKYNVINFEGSRLFATAGLSSYIMLNEDYNFYYAGGSNGLEENLSVKNGSRHLLNNAGFSVGYELDILPNWSLRAEPFIKVPLSGVGWGDVKLYSMGSFISINYQL